MNTPRDPEQLIKAFLDDGIDELPDRSLDVVRASIEHTRQWVVIGPWKEPQMFNYVRLALAAAAVVAVAFIGLNQMPNRGTSPGATPNRTITASPSATPAFASGEIAFTKTVNGNTDIYLINVDGSGLVRLTDDPAADWQMSWTADGKGLVLSRRTSLDPEASDIYALDVASGLDTRLTDAQGVEGDPFVSPTGTRIAYDHFPADPGLHVMDIDGSNSRLIWNPKSDQYTLVGWTGDEKGLYVSRAGIDVQMVDIETGAVTDVISDRAEHVGPALSRDATMIAFSRHASPGVFVRNLDGGSPGTQVAGNAPARNDGDYLSAWAPDGQRLAFRDPDGWIYVVRTDGSDLTRLVEGNSPAWRPAP